MIIRVKLPNFSNSKSLYSMAACSLYLPVSDAPYLDQSYNFIRPVVLPYFLTRQVKQYLSMTFA